MLVQLLDVSLCFGCSHLHCSHRAVKHDSYVSISQTQQIFFMFIIVLGQRVSILIESSAGHSKIQILT